MQKVLSAVRLAAAAAFTLTALTIAAASGTAAWKAAASAQRARSHVWVMLPMRTSARYSAAGALTGDTWRLPSRTSR